MVQIQKVDGNDIPQLEAVFSTIIQDLSYYNENAIQNELKKYTAVELRKKVQEDPDSILIAKENGTIVGFCFSRQDDMLIWLEWFGVVPSGRRKGIGKRLIESLERTVKGRNAHKIWCDCRTENVKSINLLSGAGYSQICTLLNHWYGQDFILLQKEIL